MLLINCKSDLKLTPTKYSIFSANENDNSNDNGNNIIFAIKAQNYLFLLSLYLQKIIKKY